MSLSGQCCLDPAQHFECFAAVLPLVDPAPHYAGSNNNNNNPTKAKDKHPAIKMPERGGLDVCENAYKQIGFPSLRERDEQQ